MWHKFNHLKCTDVNSCSSSWMVEHLSPSNFKPSWEGAACVACVFFSDESYMFFFQSVTEQFVYPGSWCEWSCSCGTVILWQHLVPLSALKLHCVQPVARTNKHTCIIEASCSQFWIPTFGDYGSVHLQNMNLNIAPFLYIVILYKILGEKHLFQHTKTC